jgi:tagatose 1,6-diphosphate aldolase GatY/KbaY
LLAPFSEILRERRAANAAAGAFTCYDISTALGVIAAAEEREAPIILLVSKASFVRHEARLFVAALLAVAREARVPVCVQLDHVAELALIEAAFAAGLGAVLADGSTLDMQANISLVRRARAAAPPSAGIEAELGHIEGSEDIAAAVESGKLTDPQEAKAFVEATGIDCLAVSIGNVHGTYSRPLRLDWDRLVQIKERVPHLPLSLHGASGIPDKDLRRAVGLGICKVNVNTELRRRYFRALSAGLHDSIEGVRLLDLQSALIDAIADSAGPILDLLAPPARTSMACSDSAHLPPPVA